MDEDLGGVHYEDPFLAPAELREPTRRLRGRMTAGVTVWTSGRGEEATGLTMSSVVVAEGRPSILLGLITDTTSLWDAIHATGAFVVHVLEDGHRLLAERFAGRWPAPGGLLSGLDVETSEWGPVLSTIRNRAYCRYKEATEAGYQHLIRGEIERIELAELAEPLVYFRGRYRHLRPPAR
ncbi:MAG: flavin reductase family protein [Actinomycetota bacterium]